MRININITNNGIAKGNPNPNGITNNIIIIGKSKANHMQIICK